MDEYAPSADVLRAAGDDPDRYGADAPACGLVKPGTWASNRMPVCVKPAGHEPPHESQPMPRGKGFWQDEPAFVPETWV